MATRAEGKAAARTAKQGDAVAVRRLVVVLGDQLDLEASGFDDFDASLDAVWMAEVTEESTHVWSSKPRITLFLAAMRHFAQALRAHGRRVLYTKLDDAGNRGSLAAELQAAIERCKPESLVMTAPGDWRVLAALREVAAHAGVALDVREDRHFFCTVREFAAHAKGRKSLRMEYFYREQRQRHRILLEDDSDKPVRRRAAPKTGPQAHSVRYPPRGLSALSDGRAALTDQPPRGAASAASVGAPVGGQWNFDAENREAFAKDGPRDVPAPLRFEPDAITREVIALVEQRFADHPGRLASFAWPLTRDDALTALHAFVAQRLPSFGRWQDAMWPNEPWLWHSHLSAAMNLKLLSPREVVDAAVAAWREGKVPLPATEGFVRQILGWREYVRGVYWTRMPDYLEGNAFDAQEPLPDFYWTGATSMACMADAIGQTLEHGYAHHIQRLMVTGLYALLLGVHPKHVHEWYLAVYVDAVEWVELPNTLGMSQAADGDGSDGAMASKPYIASGKYIQRMSAGRYCATCRFNPAERTGDRACPFTTLYWDFLLRHEKRLAANPRTVMQTRNLVRVPDDERTRIRERARAIRAGDARLTA